jgi:hypothetical protein
VLKKMWLLREYTNFDLTLIAMFDEDEESGKERLCLRLMYNQLRFGEGSAHNVLVRYGTFFVRLTLL